MEDLLKSWGLEEYIEIFQRNDIDINNISLLTDETAKDLIQSLGKRIIFLKKLKEFKDINAAPIVLEDITNVASDDASSISASSVSTIRSVTSDYSAIPDINSQVSFYVEDDYANAFAPDLPDFDLKNLLKITPNGNVILLYYGKHSTLLESHRRSLVDIIIKHIYVYIFRHRITVDQYQLLVSKILNLFPNEVAGTYYLPAIRKCSSTTGRTVFAKGRLVDKVRNLLFKSRERKCRTNSNGVPPQTEEQPEQDLSALDSDHDYLWLKSRQSPWTDVIEKWQLLFQKRRNLKYPNINHFFEAWPILNNVRSHELISLDFDKLYPQQTLSLFLNWDNFIEKVIEKRQNQASQEVLSILENTTDEDQKFSVQLHLLCNLLPPKGRIRVQKKMWKFSTIETIEGIIVHVKGACEIETKLEQLTKSSLIRKQTLQPFLLVVGPAVNEIETCYVVVNKLRYQFSNTKTAFDILMKQFFVLNTQYPVQSEHILTIIQKSVYGIHTKYDKVFPNLMDLL